MQNRKSHYCTLEETVTPLVERVTSGDLAILQVEREDRQINPQENDLPLTGVIINHISLLHLALCNCIKRNSCLTFRKMH